MLTNNYGSTADLIHSLTHIDIMVLEASGHPMFKIQENWLPEFQQSSKLQTIFTYAQKYQYPDYFTYTDPGQLNYVTLKLPTSAIKQPVVILGPFLTTAFTIDEVNDIIAENGYNISERSQLEQFYQSLPVLSSTQINDLGTLLVNLFSKPLVPATQGAKLISNNPPTPKAGKIIDTEHQQQIVNNYLNEEKITNAIASGNEVAVRQLSQTMTKIFDSFSNRIPNKPLRSSKNICFVFNTICRIAAHKGGVHPLYLNDISEKYALLIEKQVNLQGLHTLVVSMTDEYCKLVQQVSTNDFSPMIKRAADYILLNLGHPIVLDKIAESIGTNPSYLSRKFKQEAGLTITEYINTHRIKEAKQYLSSGQPSITDIAMMVGFNDLNYFIRVFKKVTGKTPSQFRRKTTGAPASK